MSDTGSLNEQCSSDRLQINEKTIDRVFNDNVFPAICSDLEKVDISYRILNSSDLNILPVITSTSVTLRIKKNIPEVPGDESSKLLHVFYNSLHNTIERFREEGCRIGVKYIPSAPDKKGNITVRLDFTFIYDHIILSKPDPEL